MCYVVDCGEAGWSSLDVYCVVSADGVFDRGVGWVFLCAYVGLVRVFDISCCTVMMILNFSPVSVGEVSESVSNCAAVSDLVTVGDSGVSDGWCSEPGRCEVGSVSVTMACDGCSCAGFVGGEVCLDSVSCGLSVGPAGTSSLCCEGVSLVGKAETEGDVESVWCTECSVCEPVLDRDVVPELVPGFVTGSLSVKVV